jgi:ubiquinone/menaquinone biosynthesis C-methylase UbiE
MTDDMDQRLFEHYLALAGPEAGPWNRSPRSLYIEYWTRDFIAKRLEPFDGMRVCNVGIGTGGWDDFLGDWLNDKGRLTSVDIDPDICELFEYRQKREGHLNPSTVVCADILSDSLPAASFDVVTVIGSTVGESEDYDGCLDSCWRLVREGGHMMYMDFLRRPPERFEAWAKSTDAEVKVREDDATARACAFWVRRR